MQADVQHNCAVSLSLRFELKRAGSISIAYNLPISYAVGSVNNRCYNFFDKHFKILFRFHRDVILVLKIMMMKVIQRKILMLCYDQQVMVFGRLRK